ncbi:3-oxoacyl-ACP reductase [Pseudomonas aeruginosa]|nr:3-oxoacyl-ACP reductase [Pseudomonas aeruginosa]
MTDRYIAFANSPVGRRLVGAVGLPSPLRLERWQAGRVRPLDGPLVIGGSGALAEAVLPFAGKLTDAVFAAVEGQFELPRWTAEHSPRAKAVLFDASGLSRFEQLVALRDFFQPVLKGLDTCPKVVVLGRAPESLKDPVAASVQRSLEGFTRSLGKEIRRGGNVQLLYVGKGAEDQLEGALRFFLSPKSAYVSGQVIRLAANSAQVHDWSKPLAGQRALVTGAARGIGAAIAETLARDGAEVVLLDVPPARETLEGLAARLGGRAVALDICAADAGQQLVDALPEGVDIVVHNAGITRDKTLAKMSSDFWNSVINVNLNAPQVLTQALLDGGKLHDNGRVVLLASISGIAGNLGQSNYAVSKAGLIGLAQAWAPALGKRGITINAVAPGFIETQMTAAIPLTIREAGRRMNSMSQGGLPQDVAETVAWFAQPSSGAVSGQVLRVCGQSLLGA